MGFRLLEIQKWLKIKDFSNSFELYKNRQQLIRRGYFHFFWVFPEKNRLEVIYIAALPEIDVECCRNLRYT